MFGSRLISLTCLVSLAACSGADGTGPSGGTTPPGGTAPPDSSPPVGISPHTTIYAASPTTILGLPGELASAPPSVLIAISPTGVPVAGVSVSFAFSDGRGTNYSTVTNARGLAVLESLRFDDRPGSYTITATVAGVGSVAFSAISIGGQLIATYDLRKMGGEGYPFMFGGEPINISGAHYELFDDGTYRRGYEWNGHTNWSTRLPFIRRGEDKIEFYVTASTASAFYASRNYLFAVARLTGDTMTVVYEDFVDFEDEEYSLAN